MIWLIILKFSILLIIVVVKINLNYTPHTNINGYNFPVSGCWNVSGTPHNMYMAITEMGCGFDRRVGFV